MGETIVLPRSGVVLTRGPFTGTHDSKFERVMGHGIWHSSTGPLELVYDYFGTVHRGSCGRAHEGFSTRDECVAWLDARVLELRAALLPPGAIVLRPKNARYFLAGCLSTLPGNTDKHPEEMLPAADVVLAALAERSRNE